MVEAFQGYDYASDDSNDDRRPALHFVPELSIDPNAFDHSRLHFVPEIGNDDAAIRFASDLVVLGTYKDTSKFETNISDILDFFFT